MKKAARRNRKKKKLSRRLQATVLILGAAFLSAAALYYLVVNTRAEKGTLATRQQFPTSPQEAYNNLDLEIAGQYHFQGSAIKKVRDLGIENNVVKSIVSFRVAADSLTEYALMTMPASPKPAKGYPLIILCHGYANPKVYSTYYYYLSDMEEYSRDGFVVIKPDFRGQGLSKNAGKADSAYYSMAYNTDLMSLIASAKQTDYIDQSNINLWGHSMGAYLALRSAVISPDIKNLILLSGPVGNFKDMYGSYVASSDLSNPNATVTRKKVLARYGTPVSNPSYWNTVSPLSYLNQIKAYVQIHVGSADGIVPPRFSAQLNNALDDAKKPHSYYIYKGGFHGLVDQRPEIYLRSLKLMLSKSAS